MNKSKFNVVVVFAAASFLVGTCFAEEQAPDCHPGSVGMSSGTATSRKPVPAAGPYVPISDKNLVISERAVSQGRNQKIVLFKDILIDRHYPSMGGPWSRAYLPTVSAQESPSTIWITAYRAEVLDSGTGRQVQEYMCHTKLDLAGGNEAPAALRGVRSQFVISQGQDEARFPKGYALRTETHTDRKLDINIMVLNSAKDNISRKVDFKASVEYADDATARREKLIPLFETSASVYCPASQCENASYSGDITLSDGQKAFGHWLVPPGRQVVRMPISSIVPYDTTVHYIMMHLHPYAESMELRDSTTGESIWIGRAATDGAKPILLRTDFFSSRKGKMLFKDHQYEVISTYHNPTQEPVDAMASLWIYAKEKS